MKTFIQTTGIVLMLLGLVACGPVTPVTQEALSTVQPTTAEGYYPLTAHTGIEEIDAVLEAAAADDVKMLHPFLGFTDTQCTRQDGLGGPPKCREEEAEGTPVEALPFLGSEGSFLRKDELENWKGIDVSGLLAVYETSAEVYEDEIYPAGEYTILLAGSRDEQPIALRLRAGKIVRIDYLFDFGMESLDAILQREASKVILAPPAK